MASVALDDSRLNNAPKPPAFLDPLSDPEDCYYYSVPTFYETSHPFTIWMLKRILANDIESLRRKIEFSPESLINRYFQVLDDPTIYLSCSEPMFHTRCLLYLSPLGLSLYFKSLSAVELFLTCRTPNNTALASATEPQFASHVQDLTDGDFHAFTPFVVMMRRKFFDAAVPLQQSGWHPERPFALPLRRRYERRVLYCRDWLDAGLALITSRTLYPISALVLAITAYPLYTYSRLPIGAVKPQPKTTPTEAKGNKNKKNKDDPNLYERHGYMPVGDKPLTIPLVGAKNVLQLCEIYDRLQQTRTQANEIRSLLKEAAAVGLNLEILQMQAEECISEDPIQNVNDNVNNVNFLEDEEELPPHSAKRMMWRLNSNNHAKKSKPEGRVPIEDKEHCSEPLRILVFCLTKDRSGNTLSQCLDAVGAYVRRKYFNCSQELPSENGHSRDTRNILTCLLNLIAHQQDAISLINKRIRMGSRRWRALAHVQQHHKGTITKISGLMTSILLSSKQIVSFLTMNTFPPYSADSVDFNVSPKLSRSMTSLRYSVVKDLNACKDSWKYLTKEMLSKVVQNSVVLLHFRVGKRPTEAKMEEYRDILSRKKLGGKIRKQ